MSELLWALLGLACGGVSAMGLGGGSVLLVVLTAFLSKDPTAARFINLCYFLPCAAISATLHYKKGYLDLRVGLWCAAGGMAGAVFGALLSLGDGSALIQTIFYLFMGGLGFFELLRRD